MNQQVVVIGLGRFGSSVAKALYNLGHEVLAIDKNEDRVQSMMGQVSFPVTGDASNEAVLRELGVDKYDAAIVAVGTDIVASVLSTVVLKNMDVPYVVARAEDDLHGNTLERIGADKVVHAESEMGVRLAHGLFNPNVQEYLELTPEYGLSRIRAPQSFDSKTLRDLGFSNPRDKYGLAAIALLHGREVTLNPDIDESIKAGDVLILAGKDELLDKLPS